MAGGAVHLMVLPNASRFHDKLKTEVYNKKYGPVKIPVDVDDREWERFKQDVRDTKTVHTVKVFVDDDNLIKKLDEYENSEGTISRSLTMDTSQADRDLSQFEMRASEDPITKYVIADFSEADDNIKDFHRKWDDSPIVQKVILDIADSIKGEESPLIERLVQKRSRQIKGVINPIEISDQQIDSLNFIPRLMSSMNKQLDIGMRQIYDQYFAGMKRIYGLASKPLINIRQDFNQADNFSDFFGKIGTRIEEARRNFPKFERSSSLAFAKAIRDTYRYEKALFRMANALENAPLRLKTRFGIMFRSIKAGMTAAAELKFPGLEDSLKGFKGNLGKVFSEAIRDMSSSFPVASRKMHNALLYVVEGVFAVDRAVTKVIKSTSSAIKNGLFRPIGRGFAFVGKAMRDAVANLDMYAIKSIPSTLRDKLYLAINTHVGGAIYDSARKVAGAFIKGFQLDGILMAYGPKIRGVMSAVFGSAATIAQSFGRNMSRYIGDSFEFVTRKVREFSDFVGRGLRSSMDFVGRSFASLNKRVRLVGSAIASLGSGFARFGALAGRTVGHVARLFGTILGPIMRGIGGMNALFGVFRAVVGRMSNVLVGFGRVAFGTFGKLAGILNSAVVPAIMAVVAGVALMGGQVLIGGVLALAGAFLAVAHGAMLISPALVAAGGVGFAVLKMGLKDVKTGIQSAFDTDSIEDFEEAIKDMHPAVQSIARTMRQFKPAMEEMRNTIQANMLEGLAPKMESAMNALFPIFRAGAEKMASAWNNSFSNVLDALAAPEAIKGTEAIMNGVNEMATAMEPLLANLVKAAGSLAEQGAKFLGPIGGWMTEQSEALFKWAEGLKEIDPTTGQSAFDNIVHRAAIAGDQISDIFGGAFGTLGNVLYASLSGGTGMLDGMAESMQRLKEATDPGTEGFRKIAEFAATATDFAGKLADLIVPIAGALGNVAGVLVTAGNAAIGGLVPVAEALNMGTEGFKQYAAEFGANIGQVVAATAPIFGMLLQTLQPVAAGLGEGINKMFVPALEALYPAFETLMGFGEPIGSLLATVGEAVGKIFASLGPVVDSALGILEPFIPVLEKIVGWIGDLVSKAVEVATPLLMLRDQAVNGFVEALGPLVDVLGNGLMGVLEALAPLFVILGDLFARVVEMVTPLIPVLSEIARVLFVALIDVINAVMPIIPPLIDIVSHLAGVFVDILIVALNIVLQTFKTVWPLVSTILQFTINNIIIPLVNLLGGVFKILANIIKFVVEKIIVPAFNFLRSVFEVVFNFFVWMIDKVVQPAIDRMKQGFEWAVDKITKVWNTLKRVFSDPIKFFIDIVVNKGIVGTWNWVMDKFGQDDKKLQPYGVPGEMNFHSGGVLPGMSVGKDNYNFVDQKTGFRLGLAGGEGIMRQEFVSAVGGERGIRKLNEDARHGRLNRVTKANREAGHHYSGGVISLGDLANGGVIDAMSRIVRQKYPSMALTSALRFTDSGYHSKGLATDWAWPGAFGNHPAQLALANDIANTYPGSAQLIYDSPGWSRNIYEGRPAGAMNSGIYKTAQAGPHHNHVHWAMTVPPNLPFGGGVFEGGNAGGGGGGAFSIIGEVMGKITSGLGSVVDELKGKIGNVGMYGDMIVGISKRIVDSAKEALTKKVTELAGSLTGRVTNLFGGVSGNVESYRAGIEAAFRRQGEEPLKERVDALLRQIQSESGGDPNVAQKIVDVNGTGESAGVGLYQFIPGTFAAYRDPTLPNDRRNVEASHNAAVRYFRDRHKWNTGPGGVGRGHGWKDGGVLPEFFDQGGVANGIGHLMKNTIQPERVLSPAQTKAFNDFVYRFMPELVDQFRRDPMNLGKHFDSLNKEIGRIYTELREGNIARLQAGLVDTFRRRANGEDLQANRIDTRFDLGWGDRNWDKLQDNLGKAAGAIVDANTSPEDFLEAEKRAREQLEEKASQVGDQVADKVEDQTEAVENQTQEQIEAQQQADQEERRRIEEAKADGSYYYGYKVLGDNGEPEVRKKTSQEEGFNGFMESASERVGLGNVFSGIMSYANDFEKIGAGVTTAIPSWIAAINGDPSGLAYNIAVGQARVREDARNGLADLGPSAIAGIVEMAISGSSAGGSPFIGEVNTGMTPAQLMQTLETYEMRRSRRGTGTTRVR